MSRLMAFIDGENLTTRFESSLADGKSPRKAEQNQPWCWGVMHDPGRYVWSPMTLYGLAEREEILRVHYYTTFSGATDELDKFVENLKWRPAVRIKGEITAPHTVEVQNSVPLLPRVFQKTARKTRTKSVDINLCVDVMEYVRNGALDSVFLVTGDVDYVPLVESVMRAGKQVYVAALSNGLSARLRSVPDVFLPLDHIYFSPPANPPPQAPDTIQTPADGT